MCILCTFQWEQKMVQTLWDPVGHSLILSIEYNTNIIPAVPLLALCQEDRKHTHPQLHIAHSSTTYGSQKAELSQAPSVA